MMRVNEGREFLWLPQALCYGVYCEICYWYSPSTMLLGERERERERERDTLICLCQLLFSRSIFQNDLLLHHWWFLSQNDQLSTLCLPQELSTAHSQQTTAQLLPLPKHILSPFRYQYLSKNSSVIWRRKNSLFKVSGLTK